MRLRGAAIALAALLLAACAEKGTPFPLTPRTPYEFNLGSASAAPEGMEGAIRTFVYDLYGEEGDEPLVQRMGVYDTAGHCLDYYVRDQHETLHLNFRYDEDGFRTEEYCYRDTVGKPFDGELDLYSHTTYSYDRHHSRCKASVEGSNGKRYAFKMRFDGQGLLSRYIYPDGSRLSFKYDKQGRMVRQTYADASYEDYFYDDRGVLVGSDRHTEDDALLAPRVAAEEATRMAASRTPPVVDSLGRVVEADESTLGEKVMAYYAYDEHDNWIIRKVERQHRPSTVEMRFIYYYD